jgi:hypothetical protein
MGTAKIWYWPHDVGTVEEIDLGEALSDLQFETRVDQSVAEGITGIQSTQQYSSRAIVRVINERFSSASLARSLLALRDHLRRGGLCMVAEDSALAWAAFSTVVPTRGAVTVPTHAAPWPVVTNPTLPSGAEIEVLGSQPTGMREYTTLTGTLTGNNPLTATFAALRFPYRDEGAAWTLLRHRGFWPVLRLPIGERNQPIVTDDHRLTYTLDVSFEEAIDVIAGYASIPGMTVSTTTVTGTRSGLGVGLVENPPGPPKLGP